MLDILNPSSYGPAEERKLYVWGKKDTFLTFLGSSDGVNFKILYRYFITKYYVFLCYFILKTVHIFVFVQKNKLDLKYWFLPVPSTPCLTVSCPVTPAANSGILEQQDGRLGVVILNQCLAF